MAGVLRQRLPAAVIMETRIDTTLLRQVHVNSYRYMDQASRARVYKSCRVHEFYPVSHLAFVDSVILYHGVHNLLFTELGS